MNKEIYEAIRRITIHGILIESRESIKEKRKFSRDYKIVAKWIDDNKELYGNQKSK